MPNYLKPQSPLQNKEDYFYPLTTIDQVIIDDKRLSDYSIVSDDEIIVTLFASKWTMVNGQYRQTITINNLNENYNVSAKIAYTNDCNANFLIAENTAYIKYAKQDDNRITFYCMKNKPIIDIPVELEVYV